MENNFDPVTYSIGDKVIARNKEPDLNGKMPVEEEIVATDTIEYSTNMFCQVLYFASNPKSFELAFNFEPVDPDEKVKYYEIMGKFSFTRGRGKSTKTVKSDKPKTVRQMTMKNFLKDKSI
jgi:hypothetical protein